MLFFRQSYLAVLGFPGLDVGDQDVGYYVFQEGTFDEGDILDLADQVGDDDECRADFSCL